MTFKIALLCLVGAAAAEAAIKFDKAKFDSEIKARFNAKTMGFAVTLLAPGGNGAISSIAGGKGRTATDGQLSMTSSLPSNLGSVTKFIAGVSLLHLFENAGPSLNPNKLSVDQMLNVKIWYYLPKIWQQGMHDSIKQITFRELLQHKSGLRNGTSSTVFGYLKAGVKASDRGVRKYANVNMTMVSILVGAFGSPALRAKIEKMIKDENLKASDSKDDEKIHYAYLGWYTDYAQKNLMGKASGQVKITCNPGKAFGKQVALMYATKSDTDKGQLYDGSGTAYKLCGGAGGWYASAYALTQLMQAFGHTEKILSNGLKEKMHKQNDSDDRLVWSFQRESDYLGKNHGMRYVAYMGGDHTVSGKSAHAAIVKLPNGYYGIGLVNSDELDSGSIAELIKNSFVEAIK